MSSVAFVEVGAGPGQAPNGPSGSGRQAAAGFARSGEAPPRAAPKAPPTFGANWTTEGQFAPPAAAAQGARSGHVACSEERRCASHRAKEISQWDKVESLSELSLEELAEVDGGSLVAAGRFAWEAFGVIGRIGTIYEVGSSLGQLSSGFEEGGGGRRWGMADIQAA